MKQQPSHVFSNTSSWIVVTALVVAFLVFDGIITNLPSYSLSSHYSFGVHLFYGTEVSICIISQVFYLRIIRLRYSANSPAGNFRKYANITHTVVSITQYLIIVSLIATVLEIEASSQYHTVLIQVSVLLSVSLSAGLSALLAYRFLRWIKYRGDCLIVAYTAAAILICINSLFVALFNSLEVQVKPSLIDPSFSPFTSLANVGLHEIQLIISFASFLSLWIASTFLLRRYRKKWGTIKFYTIVSIPLVYYLGILQLAFSNLLVHYHLMNILQIYTFNTVNSILTKPVGGILFGVAFWIVGRSVNDKNISDYMKISALGIMLLSISNQDAGLYLLPYPPFGLPTITFMGISSYMLFVGLYYSAISVSVNAELRNSIEKSVEKEFSFVSKIGLSQMEHEIQTRVKTITKRSAETLEENSGVQVSLEGEEIDAYIKLVIKEKERMLNMTHEGARMYQVDTKPFGKSWAEWAQLWWKWCYSDPAEKSPVSDASGELCSRGQIYEDVWFLAGTFGGPRIERTCTVPAGRSIFFPLVNDLISFATDPHLKTTDELISYAKRDLDETSYLYLRINEVERGDLKTLTKNRISTGLFDIALAPKGSEKPEMTKAVSDGYWVFLEPLPAGRHRVQFGGEKLQYDKVQGRDMQMPKFRVDVGYNINIL